MVSAKLLADVPRSMTCTSAQREPCKLSCLNADHYSRPRTNHIVDNDIVSVEKI